MKRLEILIIACVFHVSNCNLILAQDSLYFEKILEFTSNEKFITSSAYKIFSSDKFSSDSSINLRVEGNISTKNFSFALITMLPRLKQFNSGLKKIDFNYSNLNDRNFKEASVIEAIRVEYPEKLIDYLIGRARFNFENEWSSVVTDLGMDKEIIRYYISVTLNKALIINKFSTILSKYDYRIFINNI